MNESNPLMSLSGAAVSSGSVVLSWPSLSESYSTMFDLSMKELGGVAMRGGGGTLRFLRPPRGMLGGALPRR